MKLLKKGLLKKIKSLGFASQKTDSPQQEVMEKTDLTDLKKSQYSRLITSAKQLKLRDYIAIKETGNLSILGNAEKEVLAQHWGLIQVEFSDIIDNSTRNIYQEFYNIEILKLKHDKCAVILNMFASIPTGDVWAIIQEEELENELKDLGIKHTIKLETLREDLEICANQVRKFVIEINRKKSLLDSVTSNKKTNDKDMIYVMIDDVESNGGGTIDIDKTDLYYFGVKYRNMLQRMKQKTKHASINK